MGMYTELDLKVAIENEPIVVDILKDLSNGSITVKNRLDHPFFKTDRCNMIGRCGSYYFDGQPYIQFRYDKIAKCWFLTTCFNLKNYNQEIEKFLDWLCPFILTEGYIGTYWYEEQEEPMNIYKENRKIKIGDNNLNSFWKEEDK
jgi:hypothetical protein